MGSETLLQYFEWYLPPDQTLWRKAAAAAPALAKLGVTGVWLPPAYKGQAGKEDVGYGAYDLYDLGEFDQKGAVATKYGTRQEYCKAVRALQKAGLAVYGDIVLNHKMGADEAETVRAAKTADEDRAREISGEEPITAWTKFTFPGRGGKYSDFQWDWTCFDGVDWDERSKARAVYQFEGKAWDGEVDGEHGNYDYLMGADLDMSNPKVVAELDRWGAWYVETSGIDGVRLDAVKHIPFSFFTHWLTQLHRAAGRQLPAVGEYWSPDLGALTHYLDACGQVMRLFDVPLHFQFNRLSTANGNFDLRGLFANTLVGARPAQAVTFVDNHDTQPGQALQSWVSGWCKPLAYACILLRAEGTPCVFYGDLYGIPHDGIPPVAALPRLLLARKYAAWGSQTDYLDDANVIGWTRGGDGEHPGSGLAAVLTDGAAAEKKLCVGAAFAGQTFVDCLGGCAGEVVIGENGMANFPVNGGSAAVWVPQKTARRIELEAQA